MANRLPCLEKALFLEIGGEAWYTGRRGEDLVGLMA